MFSTLEQLESLVEGVKTGRRGAFCLVVARKGSTPQVPGASLAVWEDGATLGTIGGGIVEAQVLRRARECARSGARRLFHFDLDADASGQEGAICSGWMDIACVGLADTAALAPFTAARAALRERRAGALPLDVLPAVEETASPEARIEKRYLFHIRMPPRLYIAGGGHVGEALARLAARLEFEVTIVDDREEFANARRFPPPLHPVTAGIAAWLREAPVGGDVYVVIVTRGHRHDREALEAVVNRPARYIGLIGSRRKIQQLFGELEAAGVSRERLSRVRAPIGLPIGAVTVEEIAVSIAAQLIEERRRQSEPLVEGPLDPGGAGESA